ncbi:hypothetical protein HFO09_33790 [Rhizobium laguerreae]|nr:hypothetical protein [Rhizobium laguerreae]MBY3259534.1 hypothetical protein [Rhizobium laguerreae]MBY3287040.1 hypothetical protein [Rhizobium laguerreae]MBY3293940.1 hypothetical protein [Rhizobium laguerreae]
MTTAAIAALMDGDALAAVKDLDGARHCSKIDLLANEGMGDGIKEAFELDVIIGRDTEQTPFGEFVVSPGRLASAARSTRSNTCRRVNTQSTHEVIVDAIKCH